jgi:hypothetical protein
MLGSKELHAARLAPTTDGKKMIRPTFGFEGGWPDAVPLSGSEFILSLIKLLFEREANPIPNPAHYSMYSPQSNIL